MECFCAVSFLVVLVGTLCILLVCLGSPSWRVSFTTIVFTYKKREKILKKRKMLSTRTTDNMEIMVRDT